MCYIKIEASQPHSREYHSHYFLPEISSSLQSLSSLAQCFFDARTTVHSCSVDTGSYKFVGTEHVQRVLQYSLWVRVFTCWYVLVFTRISEKFTFQRSLLPWNWWQCVGYPWNIGKYNYKRCHKPNVTKKSPLQKFFNINKLFVGSLWITVRCVKLYSLLFIKLRHLPYNMDYRVNVLLLQISCWEFRIKPALKLLPKLLTPNFI
jgi:hypothetical protein